MSDSRLPPALVRLEARRATGLALVLCGALFTVGCDEKEKRASSGAPSAEAGVTADKYATADPKLAKALQATTSASAASDKGPPPSGVFPPGAADARHRVGAPTTVDLISDGAEPQVSLLASVDGSADGARSGNYGPAALELTTHIGRSMLPTVDFGLALGPAKKDDGGGDWLVAEVKKATPTREQMAQLPPEAGKQIAALAGSTIRVKLGPDGRESDVRVDRARGAAAELDQIVQGASEAVVFATVPLPSKPVGMGAQWIAESRMLISGVDVIVYRAYRITELSGDRVRLSLDAKAYATTKEVTLPGLPPGASLEQYEAQLSGDISLARGEWVARSAQLQEHLTLVLSSAQGTPPAGAPPGQPPGGMMSAQLQTQATFVRGDDQRVTAKQP